VGYILAHLCANAIIARHVCVCINWLRSNEDHETALSAVRNLNGTDCGGRPLRIDLADSDPFLEGKTTVRGEILDAGDHQRPAWGRDRDGPGRRPDNTHAFMAGLPPGLPVKANTNVLDAISQVLATMNPQQLIEVLAQMKVSSSSSTRRLPRLRIELHMSGFCDHASRTSPDPASDAPAARLRSISGTAPQQYSRPKFSTGTYLCSLATGPC
jgi:hypothetical protein